MSDGNNRNLLCNQGRGNGLKHGCFDSGLHNFSERLVMLIKVQHHNSPRRTPKLSGRGNGKDSTTGTNTIAAVRCMHGSAGLYSPR